MPATQNDIPHFSRDPSLKSSVADDLTANAANAENLIMAWENSQTPEQVASGLLSADKEQPEISYADIAKAAGYVSEEQIRGYTKRGQYLSFVFEGPGGRPEKDVLLIDDDGKLELPETSDTPQRRALRVYAESKSKVVDAEAEAARIVAEARAEADKIRTEAAQAVRDEAAAEADKAGSEAAAAEEGDVPPKAAPARKKADS